MVTTTKLKLYPPNKSKLEMLIFLSKEHPRCVNWWIDKIRLLGSTSLRDLHHRYYADSKKEFSIGTESICNMLFVAIRMARISKKSKRHSPYLNKNILFIKGRLLKINEN